MYFPNPGRLFSHTRLTLFFYNKASGPKRFMKDVVFDPHSFSRTVEAVFDMSSLIAGGEAALEVCGGSATANGGSCDDENDGDEALAGLGINVRHAAPIITKQNGNDVVTVDDDDALGKNHAFVLRLDLATWRLLGAIEPPQSDTVKVSISHSPRSAFAIAHTRLTLLSLKIEDDGYGFGGGFEGDDDYDNNDQGMGNYGGNTVGNTVTEPSFDDGVRMRNIMPLGADPFEALLDDDFDAARRAHASLNLAPREGAIVAGMAYVYREGFMSEYFFRNWASDMLVTFHHFVKAAAIGGPAHALATRAVWRVARHWLENNPEMPVGSTSEDVLFFNEGLYVLRELGIPHDKLAMQVCVDHNPNPASACADWGARNYSRNTALED